MKAFILSPKKIGLICFFGVISVALILFGILRRTPETNYLEYITGLEDVNQKLKIVIVTLETRKGHIFDEINYLHNTAISNYANQHGYEYIFRDQYTPVPEHTLNQITQRIISSYWLKLFMVRDVLYREGHVKPIKCRASLGTHVYETVQVW